MSLIIIHFNFFNPNNDNFVIIIFIISNFITDFNETATNRNFNYIITTFKNIIDFTNIVIIKSFSFNHNYLVMGHNFTSLNLNLFKNSLNIN